MKFIIVSILLLISTVSVFSQTELTLDQAIRLAIQKNSSLISYRKMNLRSESM